ncbi:MAG: glucose 1-dehydrogenase [Actinomycetota bacterium]|nr:glucose 1-dehydrogenase [Actinomycetota bacterium]
MNSLDVLAPFRLDGRTAVVTGASSGLGARFARVLHAAGATVVAAARRTERLAELAAELHGERLVAVTCDVTREPHLEHLVDAALEVGGGRVDVLVNNAGVSNIVPAEDEAYDDFRQVVDVNLNALFRLSQLCARPMLEKGSGSIVNIASMFGLVGSAPIKQASYCASKGAVVNLTRELGCQWARKGVRVNAIAPGWFPSEMTEDMWGDEGSEAFIARTAPMARAGAEDELDGALLFLASDASTYVTGQILAVDGGWTAR